MCYEDGEDEEIVDTAEDEEYAFMDSVMRIRPGCHRRVVRFHLMETLRLDLTANVSRCKDVMTTHATMSTT